MEIEGEMKDVKEKVEERKKYEKNGVGRETERGERGEKKDE